MPTWLLAFSFSVFVGVPAFNIALVDEGFDYADASLAPYWAINAGELPGDPRSWDTDGDGTVLLSEVATSTTYTIQDFNSNGVIDPADLFQTFSDGVDNDNNGLTDDLCGWDFFDNDPLSELAEETQRYQVSNTNDILKRALELAENSPFGIWPIRVGARGLASPSNFGLGVAYARSLGTKIIGSNIAIPGSTPFLQEVLNQLGENHLLVISSGFSPQGDQTPDLPLEHKSTVIVSGWSPSLDTCQKFHPESDIWIPNNCITDPNDILGVALYAVRKNWLRFPDYKSYAIKAAIRTNEEFDPNSEFQPKIAAEITIPAPFATLNTLQQTPIIEFSTFPRSEIVQLDT